jgi:hypothetical protein
MISVHSSFVARLLFGFLPYFLFHSLYRKQDQNLLQGPIWHRVCALHIVAVYLLDSGARSSYMHTGVKQL